MAEPTATRDPQRPLPDRVTMPLLDLVTNDALDQDYVQAAQRRARRGTDPARGAEHRTDLRGAAVVTLLFGLLVALAAVQTARNAEVDEASRDALVDRIGERRAEVRDLEERLDSLDEQIAELEATGSRVRGQLARATVELLGLQVSTGFIAVSGPGLRVTVSDNPDGSDDGRVRASDLRRLVNALWHAGAEAIAVNGRRLTAVSAIGQQGIAITVNRGPLTPPYVVSAIGDDTLGELSRTSASGAQFDALAQQFGFEVDRRDEPELQLPAAGDALLRLRYAERPTADNAEDPDPADNQEDVP